MAFFQSQTLWVQQFAEGVAVLQFDPPGKTARVTPELLDDFAAALDRIASQAIDLLIIRSLKPGSFCQGPDVSQWRSLKTADDFRRWAERGQALWTRLRELKIPTLAWVQGACLGAGLELALACDEIVAVEAPETIFGFNEADLGLVPSWGGLEMLLRRTGVSTSLSLALTGRRLGPREAMLSGLVDRTVATAEPDYAGLKGSVTKGTVRGRRHGSWRQRLLESFGWGRRLLFRGIERVQRQRLPDELPGPGELVSLLRTFEQSGGAAGRKAAAASFARLSESSAYHNLLRFHELREHAHVRPDKRPGRPRAKTVGVLGATPLGLHVVLETVRRGGHIVLREPDETRLGFAIVRLVQMLNQEITDGRLTPRESQTMLSRIRSTITWKNFGETDLVFDAHEVGDSPTARLAEAEAEVGSETILVSGSAAGRLADSPLRNPARLLGLHLFGSAGRFPVAEARQGEASAAAFRRGREWAGSVGWATIAVGDQPRLLLERLWVPAWNELTLLVREGARIDRLDQALSRFGLGRSLLEFLDQLGLEPVARLVESARAELGERIPIDPFWSEVVARGWRGKASRKGFYRYGRGRPKPNALLSNWLQHEGPSTGKPLPALSLADQRQYFQDRVILLMVNESFRCLEEGRVSSDDDLDLAMMLTDWAPHRGGPIHYAEQVGLPKIVERLRTLETAGARYRPAESLLRRAGLVA